MKIIKNKVNWNSVPIGNTMMFFGPPKTHKTTEASRWSSKGVDGVLLIDTDLGADYIPDISRIVCNSLNPPMRPIMHGGKQALDNTGMPAFEIIPPEERGCVFVAGEDQGKPMPVYSMLEVINWITEKMDANTFDYETVVIDTIDEVADWCEKAVCEELEIPAMGMGSFGSDWALARDKAYNIVTMFKSMLRKRGKNLILISHSKTTQIVEKKVQLGPDLAKGLSKKIMGACELIGYVSIDPRTKKSMLSFEAYDELQMGSRLRPLSGQTIEFGYQHYVNKIQSYEEK